MRDWTEQESLFEIRDTLAQYWRPHGPVCSTPANKPEEDEPGVLHALTGEDPDQMTLPGLPAGFLAYQKNAR